MLITVRVHARLAALLIVAAGCAAPDAATAPEAGETGAPSLAIAPPSGPDSVATGVFIDGAPLGRPGMTAWDNWTKLVGKRPYYIMWYTDWSSSFQGYAVTNAYSRGSVPVITWEMKNRQAAIPYGDVLSGRWNKYIDTWASAAKADTRQLFVRLGHEMNGNWYPWSGARNGGSKGGPEGFVATWRYVHGRFASKGVTNVTWVWCPNHASVPDSAWNAPANYYPGDAYVDWTCADGYNWGTSQTVATAGWDSKWQSFDEVFKPVYDEIATVAREKPFMIGEFASSEAGGDKPRWIADAASSMRTSYPKLRAFIWFNHNKETDWRIESSDASTKAFRSAFTGDPFAWVP